jgi:hypothetical protein
MVVREMYQWGVIAMHRAERALNLRNGLTRIIHESLCCVRPERS